MHYEIKTISVCLALYFPPNLAAHSTNMESLNEFGIPLKEFGVPLNEFGVPLKEFVFSLN
jgi:hypothetical protein